MASYMVLVIFDTLLRRLLVPLALLSGKCMLYATERLLRGSNFHSRFDRRYTTQNMLGTVIVSLCANLLCTV